MGLREDAIVGARQFMEEKMVGFGQSITVTDPAALAVILTGFATDIGVAIDPDTGVAVSGRTAEVSISMTALTDAFGALPVGVSDGTGKPWQVEFLDSSGVSHTFKIIETLPDRRLDVLLCLLEQYDGP